MKRKFAFIMAIILFFAAIPLSKGANADNYYSPEKKYNGYLYRVFYDEVIITGWYEELSPNLVIPETIEDKPVTTIARNSFSEYCPWLKTINTSNVVHIGENALSNNDGLTELILPNVITIEDFAFVYCQSLVKVSMPKVEKLGDGIFDSCIALTEIDIPASTKTMGTNPFSGCDGLVSFNVNSENKFFSAENAVLYSKDKKILVSYPTACGKIEIDKKVTEIAVEAFSYNREITNVDMSSVTSVGDEAFTSCGSLVEVNMPLVTSISERAFEYCEKLSVVQMPCVVSIGALAFAYCEMLSNVFIPASTSYLCDNPFLSCDSITYFGVDKNNQSYYSDGEIVYDKKMTTVVCGNAAGGDIALPSSVIYVGNGAFCSNENITSVEMTSVTKVGDDAFSYCHSIQSVNMSSVIEIGRSAFYDCSLLNVICIGQGLSLIENGAFYNCGYYLDNGNWENGALYFSYCLIAGEKYEMLPDEYKVKEGTRVIADGAFSFCDTLSSVYIPESVISINTNPFVYCPQLATVLVSGKNKYFSADGVALYSKDKSVLISYPIAEGDIVLSETIKTVGSYAFAYSYALTGITMKKATQIDEYAFYCCEALKKVDIPAVKIIGEYAFSEIYLLNSVKLYDIELLAKGAFAYCFGLYEVIFCCDAPKTMGEDVFSICDPCFTIYYNYGAVGFTTPEWNGYPTRAIGAVITHKVTFVDGVTNTVIKSVSVEHGKSVELPIPPVHSGYTFIKWDNSGKNITEDTEITALYQKDDSKLKAGDANGDGKVNTGDAVTILKYSVGTVTLSSEQLTAADVIPDGKVNTGDAVAILKLIAAN